MVIMVKPLIGLADYAEGFPSPDDIERFFGKEKFQFSCRLAAT
jgi:hypothetical protein